jgi:hypothetical protein
MTWQPGRESGPLGPYKGNKAVTPSDTADLPDGVCVAIYVTGAGNVSVDLVDGDTAVVIPMLAGYASKQEFAIKRIRLTSTTATGIRALYI